MQSFFSDHLSLLGRRWRIRRVPDAEVRALIDTHHLPEPLARFLSARGVHSAGVPSFLAPSLKTQMPDPAGLKGMVDAAARMADAIIHRQRIVIFGDYDVDGATSSALLVRYLRMAGHDAGIYIPDRILEGYGPNTEALLKLRAEGADMVVTVDCGTVSFEPILEAKKAGLEVIVVDHHLAVEALPEAVAIINPNRLDDGFPEKGLAAVGVCFLLVVAVNRELRGRGYFAGKAEPEILSLLDLVALGTVCDVMPLTGLNRVYVTQGLKILAQKKNLGLATLMDIARIDEAPTAYHLGFILGPRINAGGRIGKSDLGARLLTTESEMEALEIAKQLDQLNAERRTIETLVLEASLAQLESQANAPVVIASGAGWHPGVIGVVAGRLKEKLGKPVAVIGFENGIGKASARSITGVDFGSAVTAARVNGMLLAGGGHAMAAGFTVEEGRLAEFTQFLCRELEAQVALATEKRELWVDSVVGLGGIAADLVRHFERAGPYGSGHSEPLFVLPNVRIAQSKEVGQGHISCRIAEAGLKAQEKWLKAVSFRATETPLKVLMEPGQAAYHLAGRLKINRWQGRETPEFHIEDVMLAS